MKLKIISPQDQMKIAKEILRLVTKLNLPYEFNEKTMEIKIKIPKFKPYEN